MITALVTNFLFLVSKRWRAIVSRDTLLMKHYFHTINVDVMLDQCHFSYVLVPWLPVLLLLQFLFYYFYCWYYCTANTIAISNLNISDWSIEWQTKEGISFKSLHYRLWDRGISTDAVTFRWCLCAFYAKKNLKILKKHEKTKLHWSGPPSLMTWLLRFTANNML